MTTGTRNEPDVGRIRSAAHFDHNWRIHKIAPDFVVEDVWALPITGGRDDFQRLLMDFVADSRQRRTDALAVRFLWAFRTRLGNLRGWDTENESLTQAQSLYARLADDLREGPRGPRFTRLPFSPLYLLDNEFATELLNRTVHGVMHLSWVPDGDAYRAQMAVLVKPQGMLGRTYMAAIKPFRYLIVYPAMLRQWKRRSSATR